MTLKRRLSNNIREIQKQRKHRKIRDMLCIRDIRVNNENTRRRIERLPIQTINDTNDLSIYQFFNGSSFY